MRRQITVSGTQDFPGAAGPSTTQSDDSRRILAQATQAQRSGRLDDAQRLLVGLLKREPGNADALHMLGVIALRSGNPQAAERPLRQAVDLDGDNPEFLANFGTVLLMLGRPADGEAVLRRALKRRPSHPIANQNLGLLALQAGHFDDACRHLKKAVAGQPKNADALGSLGTALAKTGKPGAAVLCFRQALKQAPYRFDLLHKLANALSKQKNFDNALAIFEDLVRRAPADPQLRFDHAWNLSRARKSALAVEEYQEAIKLDPQSADAHNNLGNLLASMGRLDKAVEHLRRAVEIKPDAPQVQTNLAKALFAQGRGRDGWEICERLLAEHPDSLDARYLMVKNLHNEGRFEEAKAYFDIPPGTGGSKRVNPVDLLRLRAEDRSHRFTDDEIGVLEAAARDKNLGRTTRTQIGFTLGTVLDARGNYAEAFRHYQRGNDLKNGDYEAEQADYRIDVANLTRVFAPALFEARAGQGSSSDRPVFIVGIPRSGTTLVEQTLASHPRVEGGGELGEIQEISRAIAGERGEGNYLDRVAELDRDTLAKLAERYLAKLDRISPGALRVTDKMPHNFRFLGLIAMLFPSARVIHCRRDPMATCLSNYFQLFDGYHPHAYDLRKLGIHYRQHFRLMEHWRRVLPLPILEVRYEDTVSDSERQARKIIEFCDLPWDDSVLDFHRAERRVLTASLWQVRQPIYQDALDHWRNYEPFLAPLRDALSDTATTD